MSANPEIPVVVFAYSRPDHFARLLLGLRTERIPRLIIYCDGPARPEIKEQVQRVRALARAVDWTALTLVERETNLGLGTSILSGVTEVLRDFESAIVLEDDLGLSAGMYNYLRQALIAYWNDPKVFSVTGWTHPLVTPKGVRDLPYFDPRAECWSWGTWRRAWIGMERSAKDLLAECRRRGIDPCSLGADLVEMAEIEKTRNIWAVRWCYHHLVNGGLCLRPPRTMIAHLGYDAFATNAPSAGAFDESPECSEAPPIPPTWPDAIEHPTCSNLWQRVYGAKPRLLTTGKKRVFTILRRFLPQSVRAAIRGLRRRYLF